MNVLAYGAHAVLVECGSLEETMAVAARLTTPRLHGVDDVVPAARTVLVHGAGVGSAAELARLVDARLRAWPVPAPATPLAIAAGAGGSSLDMAGRAVDRSDVDVAAVDADVDGSPATTVEISVRYDGDDLHAVAAATGLAPADIAELHAAAIYTVAFCGFAPGFAYLVGLPPALVLARRDTPRPAVPAGSVAIAGEFSAVYPTASPGGWHLLGRTDQQLFDPTRNPPALLVPGTTVRFVPR